MTLTELPPGLPGRFNSRAMGQITYIGVSSIYRFGYALHTVLLH